MLVASVCLARKWLNLRKSSRSSGARVAGAILAVVYLSSSLEGQFDITAMYEVGVLDGPGEHVFGEYSIQAITKNGELLVGDWSSGQVRMFRPVGEFTRSVGRKGRGPGEFQEISAIALNAGEDSIYVLDMANFRVSVFDRGGRLVRDFRPDMDGYFWSVTVHPTGYLLFVGQLSGSQRFELVHVTDLRGRYVRSLAPLLGAGDLGPYAGNPLVREQLNQGAIELLPGGDLLVMLSSPFRVARYGLDGTARWLARDESIHPNPLSYFHVGQDSYRVGFYPRASYIHRIDARRFLVIHNDFENERANFEVRSLADGRLLTRNRASYDPMFRPMVALGDGSGLGIAVSSNPYPRFAVVRWRFQERQR